MPLFNRIAHVEIGKEGQTGILLKDLRISFKGKKTLKPTANTLEVSIYNLSQDTYSRINEEKNVLILYAGYKEDEGELLLFSGDQTRVFKEYSAPDIITRIECMDGIKKLGDKRVSFSYEKGTKLKTVVDDLISKLGFPVESKQYTIKNFEFTSGFSYIGSTKNALSKALEIAGLDWSIQNGSIQILGEDQTNKNGIKLSPASGMIGSPESLFDTSLKSKKKGSKKDRYKITSVLFPKLNIGDYIEVESKEVEGKFKILEHEFEGDTVGGAWNSIFEVAPI